MQILRKSCGITLLPQKITASPMAVDIFSPGIKRRKKAQTVKNNPKTAFFFIFMLQYFSWFYFFQK
jgi:hypothetical protein